MADPREVERIRNKLDGLRQKLANNEIGLPEYSAELQTLQRRLKEEQAFETQLVYKNEVITPGEKEAELARDVSQALEGRDVITPYRYTEEFVKEGVPREEAFERGKQKFRTELAPQRYGTGEFIEPLPPAMQVSNVIDPVKGLIQDPSTGEIRKGTTSELLSSALFERQRKPTELTTAQAKSLFEQRKKGAALALLSEQQPYDVYDKKESTLKEIEETLPKVEQQMDVTRSPQEPAVIAETGLDYGLRIINSMSAVAEPLLLRPAQELFGFMIGSGGPTIRKGAGYKETEIDRTGGQALTNLLTGQGAFNQVQASLLPPDENVSGLENFLSLNPMRQGTLGSGLPSLGPELLIPITPLPVVSGAAKVGAKGIRALSKGTKAQAIARTVESPLEQIRYMGARSEIDAALRSVDENLKATDIEKQIAENGGTINRPTLRKKAAETIGDIYGSHKEAIALGKAARSSIDEAIRPEMFTNPNSGYVRGLFGKKKSITPEQLQSRIQKMDEVFDGAAVTGKNERVVLRRTKQVADDVEANLTRGQKPLRDVDIVNRSVNKTKMEDLRFWNDARLEGRVPDDAMKLWDEGYELLTKQRTKPLIPDEIIRLGKVFDSLQQKGVWKANDLSFKPSDVYSATRNAVSDVMRDNFLKNIPDDFIYVSRTVAVPYKNVKNKTLQKKLDVEQQPYFESQGGNFTPQAGRRIKLLQRRTGFTLPGELQAKLNKLADVDMVKDTSVKFTNAETNLLTDIIKGELALNIMNGVRLKTGTLTSQMAEIPSGALRQTLVSSGQAPVSAVVTAKGIANSIRLIATKGGTISRSTGKIAEWLKLSDDAPPMFRQFNAAITRAHNSAIDEVLEQIQPANSAQAEQHFDNVLESYIRQDIEIQQQSKIKGSPRVQDDMDIASTARSEFVGEIDFSKQYAPRIESLIETRQSIIDDAFAKESERLVSNFENRLETFKRTLSQNHQKDLDRIERDYSREFLRNKSSVQKMRELHAQKYVEMMDDFEKKMKVAEDTLSKTYQKDFNKIRKDYEKEVLTASMNKRAAQQNLGDTRVQKIDQFEDAAITARQRLAKQQNNELERIHKAYSRKFIELRNKQRTVVSDYTTKATQTKKRFGLARQIKALDKEYKEAYAMVLNNKEVAEELLEQKIKADRKRLYNTFGKGDTAKIQKIQEVIDNAQTKYKARINKSVKEYKEMRKFLDESIAPEREEMFALMERIDVEDEIYQQKLKDLFNVEEKYKGKADITINEYEQSQKLLSQVAKAERDALYDTIANLEEGEKYQKLKQATDTKLEKLQQRIDQAIDKKVAQAETKSERVAVNRKVLQLSDKYGRDNVTDFLSIQMGIDPKNIKYDDFVKQVDFLEENMEVASEQIYRARLWKSVVEDFFQLPPNVKDIPARWKDNIYDLIRIDKTAPYWEPNNIIPLTIANYKGIIEKLRTLNPAMRNYGLKDMKFLVVPGEEVFMLPLAKRMIEIQRTKDMALQIDDFIARSPDMFVNLERSQVATLGLESTKEIADELVVQLKNTAQLAKKKGLLDEETLELWMHQIREALFDGMAVDIWRNSSREVQGAFFNKYLAKMIDEGSPVLNDVDDFAVNLYETGTLTSKTFATVEEKSRKILDEILSKFSETGLTTEQQKIVEMFERDLFSGEGVLVSMRKQYLNNLTLRSDGITDGLFTQQMKSVSDYMTRYGVSNEVMLDNIKKMQPRIEYIGKKNIGVIFGESNQEQITKVLDMISHSEKKTTRFLNQLQKQYAATKNPQADYLRYFFPDAASLVRRWSIARMLGGGFAPATRFFGMNRATAPYLFFAALGSGSMKVSTAAKFTGLAFTMGLDPVIAAGVRRVTGNKSLGGFFKANKVMVAPADEVIIRQADGAVRDLTAGELREAMRENGVLFSRADSDFMDTQWNRFLIDAKLTADGRARYGHPFGVVKKVYDNISPSGKNMWAEFAKLQDTEMRRFVFLESLKDGDTVLQASEKARRSMLDYGSLTDLERQYISKYIYFYSFMRTMGAETINTLYRGVLGDVANPSLGLLRAQSRLNTETEDRAMQMQQDSRIFNIFNESTEGTDFYVSGPANPSVSMFELMSTASLLVMGGFNAMTNEEKRQELRLVDAVNTALTFTAQKAATTYAEGNPFVSLFVEGLRANASGRPIPFPSELIKQAEQNGNLDEVIKLYNLAPRDPTPGRPLSSTGKYYDFARTEKGMTGYTTYLFHRLIGLTAFAEVASRSGVAPAAITRAHKDALRASMFAAEDMTMPSPTGEGEVSIPTESVYLKSLNKQDLDVYPDFAYGLYMLGLLTPLKATKKNVIMERLLRNTLSEIKDIEERTQQEK
jgi:hypothetical protein